MWKEDQDIAGSSATRQLMAISSGHSKSDKRASCVFDLLVLEFVDAVDWSVIVQYAASFRGI